MNVGPPPERARSSASAVTAYVARTSLPSTRTLGMPKPGPRSASGTRDCLLVGSEMAHWLFWQKKTTGALFTAANTSASFTSPCEVDPSPKYVTTAESRAGSPVPTAPSRCSPIA